MKTLAKWFCLGLVLEGLMLFTSTAALFGLERNNNPADSESTPAQNRPSVTAPDPGGKKLIRVAQELIYHTTVSAVPAKIAGWQKTGFDGVALVLSSSDGSMGFRWWMLKKRTYEEFRPEIQILKSIKNWGRLTDNFLWVTTTSVADGSETAKYPNYFDDGDWDIILNNMRLAARIAKETGLKGFVFDSEQYAEQAGAFRYPWNYPLYAADARKAGISPRSFSEVSDQVRRRGKQFAEIISREYPDIVLLVLPGLYEVAWPFCIKTPDKSPQKALEETHLSLWPAFVDGMLLGSGERATIASGCEFTYVDSQYKEMLVWRDIALRHSLVLSTVPELARKRITFAAGIWTDAPTGYQTDRFSNTDVNVNHRDPTRHKHAVHNALAASDRYAWAWGEWGRDGKSNWLTDQPTDLMKQYWKANLEGHRPQDLNWEPALKTDLKKYTSVGDKAIQADAAFWKQKEKEGYSAALNLPLFWKFRFDPESLWVYRRTWWESVDYDDAGWFAIQPTSCWQSQGFRVNGTGIYRVKFDVPSTFDPGKKEILLAFGGRGEGKGMIYLNGINLPELAATVEVTKHLKLGTLNQMTLIFVNQQGPGGLMGYVKILTRTKQPERKNK